MRRVSGRKADRFPGKLRRGGEEREREWGGGKGDQMVVGVS